MDIHTYIHKTSTLITFSWHIYKDFLKGDFFSTSESEFKATESTALSLFFYSPLTFKHLCVGSGKVHATFLQNTKYRWNKVNIQFYQLLHIETVNIT